MGIYLITPISFIPDPMEAPRAKSRLKKTPRKAPLPNFRKPPRPMGHTTNFGSLRTLFPHAFDGNPVFQRHHGPLKGSGVLPHFAGLSQVILFEFGKPNLNRK
jgi:hypothetical protein